MRTTAPDTLDQDDDDEVNVQPSFPPLVPCVWNLLGKFHVG